MTTYIKIDNPRANQMVTRHFEDARYSWLDDTPVKEGSYPRRLKNELGQRVFPYYIQYFGKGGSAISYSTKTLSDSKVMSAAEFLWEELSDVIVDENGNLEEEWNIFEAGTDREYIWHFFEEELGTPVYKLMYQDTADVETENGANIDVPMVTLGIERGLIRLSKAEQIQPKQLISYCCRIGDRQFFVNTETDGDKHFEACLITNHLNKEIWGQDREEYMYYYNILSKATSANRTYYRLKETIDSVYDAYYCEVGDIPKEFDSYEEAYDVMCKEYMKSLNASYEHPSGLPIRYKIYETKVSYYQGRENSITQAV
ncbi:MAG: hypothetical protein E7272_07575 [Pseudobutyrivibrio ruminis]|uniref:Uncharacterized protein n=1 Tax=Pseudobutyrivibrio ruminis TaxID=46206 RepID=A0A927U7E9_9FIRM|nr:hypothetical protein [Pseudobutyrivibrio ruminis]